MADTFNKILGNRLKQVRDKLGMTLQEVAKAVGFNNYQTLMSIEEGSRVIKAVELTKLAKVYLRDVSYFLSDDKKAGKEPTILWRSDKDSKALQLKEQEFLKYCYNYFELQQRLGVDHGFSLQQRDKLIPDDINFDKIEILADEYARLMQLGSRPACVLEKILEEKYNLKILYLDLGDYGSAASAAGDFGAAILVNAAEAPWRRNYDLAHELFHIITWNVFNYKEIHNLTDGKNIIEKWANAFASYLLLPQDEVKREFEARVKDNKITILDLISIAREFVVSTDAFLWRLANLKFLRKGDVETLLEKGELKDIDRIERLKDYGQDTPCISTRYISLAFKVYQKGLISRGKLAEYLNITRSDVSEVLSRYGYEENKVYDKQLTTA
jgi:Zn-dependent peptidase ImmA (M78 family)/DNA-binding XRE family transcriptional regulator